MNDDQYGDLHPWIEPEMEARLVALVLGEASDFEADELRRLMEERSELRVFKERLESVHGLLGDAVKPDDDAEWRLSGKRRGALLEAFGVEVEEEVEALPIVAEGRERRVRKQARRVAVMVAACLMLAVVLTPLFFSIGAKLSPKSEKARYLNADFQRDGGILAAPQMEDAPAVGRLFEHLADAEGESLRRNSSTFGVPSRGVVTDGRKSEPTTGGLAALKKTMSLMTESAPEERFKSKEKNDFGVGNRLGVVVDNAAKLPAPSAKPAPAAAPVNRAERLIPASVAVPGKPSTPTSEMNTRLARGGEKREDVVITGMGLAGEELEKLTDLSGGVAMDDVTVERSVTRNSETKRGQVPTSGVLEGKEENREDDRKKTATKAGAELAWMDRKGSGKAKVDTKFLDVGQANEKEKEFGWIAKSDDLGELAIWGGVEAQPEVVEFEGFIEVGGVSGKTMSPSVRHSGDEKSDLEVDGFSRGFEVDEKQSADWGRLQGGQGVAKTDARGDREFRFLTESEPREVANGVVAGRRTVYQRDFDQDEAAKDSGRLHFGDGAVVGKDLDGLVNGPADGAAKSGADFGSGYAGGAFGANVDSVAAPLPPKADPLSFALADLDGEKKEQEVGYRSAVVAGSGVAGEGDDRAVAKNLGRTGEDLFFDGGGMLGGGAGDSKKAASNAWRNQEESDQLRSLPVRSESLSMRSENESEEVGLPIENHLTDGSQVLAKEVLQRDPENTLAKQHWGPLEDPVRIDPELRDEQAEIVDKVQGKFYTGAGGNVLGNFDEAVDQFEETLSEGPDNPAARRWMSRIDAAKSDYYLAADEETRAQMLAEVDEAWELNAPPAPGQKVVGGSGRVIEKERTLAQLESQLKEVKELVVTRNSEELKKKKQSAAMEMPTDQKASGKRNETLAALKLKPGGSGGGGGGGAMTKTWEVSPNFMRKMAKLDNSTAGSDDPFADAGEGAGLIPRRPVADLFKGRGIAFPEGTGVTYHEATGTLVVTNTEESLDLMSELVDEISEVEVLDLSGLVERWDAPNIDGAEEGGPVTRTWRLHPDVLKELEDGLVSAGQDDPFADDVSKRQGEEKPMSLIEVMRSYGVSFPEGTKVSYLPESQTLVVNNTPSNMDLVEVLIESSAERVALEKKSQKLAEEEGEKSAADEAFSTFSLHVSDVSFKLAQAALAKGEWPEAERVRVEEFVNAFDYGDPSPTPNEKVACQVEQAAHPFMQQRNVMRIAMRTAAVGRASGTPLRLTILLDNSGSMERPDRAQSVRNAFGLLVDQLNPQDEVTLISFARTPHLLRDGVSGDKAQDLLRAIDERPSEGGTNLEEALRLGMEKATEHHLEGAQNRVILLTDGAANLGDAKPERLKGLVETLRQRGIAFDACGVGADGLNDDILEALTRKGDGRYYFLDRPEDADAGFAKQIAGALRPAAKNVKVQVEFNPKRVGHYALYGFEKHELKKEAFRNDSVDAAELAAEEAGVAMYHVETLSDGEGDVGTVSVRFQDMETGEMVEKIWPIPYEASPVALEEAAPSMKLAASAALLGEALKESAVGDLVEMGTLSEVTRSLQTIYPENKRVGHLIEMVEKVREMGGGR